MATIPEKLGYLTTNLRFSLTHAPEMYDIIGHIWYIDRFHSKTTRGPWGGPGLSTVGFLGQIVTFVGAGEVRSGVGTLASPMGGRCEAAGEQDAGRPKGF